MPYIKKIIMNGFKSFARKTEIPFEDSMNILVGPNGSGKSNITDAICFVLGRLSIKSIRAAKAANLVFLGSKYYKPCSEASVEMVFDNSDKIFALDSKEVSIKRMVRKNGQSIYKINNARKTRQELLELLAQAGIDPNGFNLVLQGEIASLIKINSEERRKIIEEVAGISIYEIRKRKSLKEMEKTEERLKEVEAVIKERNAYLRNLEKEKQEALNYQKLKETIKKCKATILHKKIKEKEKEIEGLNKDTEKQNQEIERITKQVQQKNSEISELEEKIIRINKLIQASTSGEQETIHKEIADLKAKVAGLNVRKENFESRLEDTKRKKQNIREKISNLEKEISEIKTSGPEIKKQQEKQKEYQEVFDVLEKNRRKFYLIKSELSTQENKKSEKHKFLIETKKELELIEKNILSLFDEIKYTKSIEKTFLLKQKTKQEIEKIKEGIEILGKRELELEKQNAVLKQNISKEEKLKKEIPQLDVCPLCRNKITKEHINYVLQEADRKTQNLKEKEKEILEHKQEIKGRISILKQKLSKLEIKLNEMGIDILKLKNADEKKQQIKRITENQKQANEELRIINEKIFLLKKDFEKLKNIEENYDEARLRLQELSFADMDVDTEVTIKQRELNRLRVEIKSIIRDGEESEQELKIINEKLFENNKLVEKKEKEEQELYEKFRKFFNDKNRIQDRQKAVETLMIGLQHEIKNHQEKINSLNIGKAEFKAQLETMQSEFSEFSGLELLSQPIEQLKEKLNRSQIRIAQFGNVNMRALDAYEKVKEQCALIQEKVATIEKEKEKVLKIIGEIDKKKKHAFMQTLETINEYFSRNFSQLSKKGEVFLELEDKQDPFAAGLNIIVKVGRGKYFDVTSLSGGEKTIVALSLIFAIQEYKPYYFYIFDEIDAALDKHNSELLAALIKKYMKSGQYVIITHNDALISEATTLYGISMQEGISKIISLKI